MAIYRGVAGVARKVISEWRGVGGVARKVKAEWRGVSGVARKVFDSWYWVFTTENSLSANVELYDYTLDFTDGVLTISATYDGISGNNNNGRSVCALLYGDFGGKTITFDYVSTNYNANYGVIGCNDYDGVNVPPSMERLLTSSGSYSGTLDSNAKVVTFNIWMGGQSPYRTASLVVRNLKIGGETIK